MFSIVEFPKFVYIIKNCSMIVLDLIHNLAILIALTFLAGLLEELFKKDTTLKYVTQGILFGIVTIIVMLNPFTLTEGLFFDGRTIVIGICTLFFGPLAGIIAAVIAAGYRIYIGGIGLFTGLLTTFGAVLTGYITYLIRKKTNFRFTLLNLYIYGLASNVVVMLLFLTIPSAFRGEALSRISFTVLVLYPVITVIAGKILSMQEDKKKYNETIKKSEEKYRAIHTNAPIPFFTIDMNGTILDCNPEFMKELEFSWEEISGKKFMAFMNSESRLLFEKILNELNQKGEVQPVELVLKKKSGDYIIIMLNAKCGSIRKDLPEIIYCVFKDITKQKIAENELIMAKEKAEESDRLKTAFLQNMSHEIRTPLNGIIGFASLLSEKDYDKENIKLYSDLILSSGFRLLTLINNILDISTIESGNLKINYTLINLNSVLRKIYNRFSSEASEKNLKFILDLGESDEKSNIESDLSVIKTVMNNLLDNALKFTNEGYIKFSYNFTDDKIIFKVTDTGCGVPESEKDKIFNRFYQVDMSISRKYEGAGLGLAICRGMLSAINGTIEVTSGQGKGSEFTVTIPLRKKEKNNDDFVLNEKARAEIRKILIAEDDDAGYDYFKLALNKNNIEVERAFNGLEAVEKCKLDKSINLVLMDIRMPVMDGYEATRQIKKINPEVKIIVQTANFTSEDRDKAFESGCDGYLCKPISPYELYSSINKIYEVV